MAARLRPDEHAPGPRSSRGTRAPPASICRQPRSTSWRRISKTCTSRPSIAAPTSDARASRRCRPSRHPACCRFGANRVEIRAPPHAHLANDIASTSRFRSLAMMYALRMALRQFRLHPAFAFVTVLVLGLGTGAATVVYTIVDSVVLRPLPYRAPDALVKFWDTNTEKGLTPRSVLARHVHGLQGAAGRSPTRRRGGGPDVNLLDPGLDPVRVKTIEASANLFSVLGVGTAGRARVSRRRSILPRTTSSPSSAIGSGARDTTPTQRSSARRSTSTGRRTLSSASCRPGFHFPDDVDVWQRLRWDLTQHSRSAHFMEGVARLADGTSLEQARAARRHAGGAARHGVRQQQQGLGVRHRPAARRSARLLPAGALCAVRRGRACSS